MTKTETTSQTRLIAASLLEKSPRNARKTAPKGGLEELKASILAHGLMQNLVVTDAGTGTFHVIAGGRRLEAIHSLQAEGKLPDDFAVPCQLVAEASAPEMSLAENFVRLAMHPADQFDAFAGLLEQGHSAADVAARFGVDESLIHKRMKLARVAPELFQKYRDDELTLECLMAFAVVDDHERQLKVYHALHGWQQDDPSAIRDALTEAMIEASSKLARFVGLDAYREAGGSTHSDLFGEDIYIEQPDLLQALAQQNLDGIRRQLEAEGWGWIELNAERDYSLINRCTRIRPQLIGIPADLLERKAELDAELEAIEQMLEETESDEALERQQDVQDRLDEVEQKLTAFFGFDGDQKALAGCFVSIGQDGTPFFDKGLVKPEHRQELAGLVGDDDAVRPQKAKAKHPLPASLRHELAAARLQVAQVELVRHPDIAFDLLVFQVTSVILGYPRSTEEAADVHFRVPRRQNAGDFEPTIAGETLASLAAGLSTDWLRQESEVARFEAFRQLPEEAKQQLLAYCVAMTLKPKLAPRPGEKTTAYDLALSLTCGDVASFWRPTSVNFLGRINRSQLLAIGREVFGDGWSHSRAADKKASLVGQLHRALADPDKPGRTPQQVERLKSWLPAGMGFDMPAAEQAKPAQAA